MPSIFSSKKSHSGSRRPKASHKQANSLSSVENRELQLKSLQGAERQLFKYDKPEQALGITELLKQHETGSRFMYAAVTGKEEDDVDSRLSKLWAWKPNLNRNLQSFDDVPNLKLYKESEVFPIKPLIDSLSKKRASGGFEYFRIVEALVIYGAIVSSDCNFTKVRVTMNDARILGDTLAKGFIADTNKESRGDLRMSYCVPVENAELISLIICREQQFLVDGLQWGVIKVKLSIEFTSFPKQYDNVDAVATNMIVGTTMSERTTNPDMIDISVSNSARKELANLYQSGDLADVDEPIKNKTSMRVAKSSIRDMPKGDTKSYGEGWSGMKIPRAPASIASSDPDDDDIDTASDIERRNILLKNHKANQELMRESSSPAKKREKGVRFGADSSTLSEESSISASHEVKDADGVLLRSGNENKERENQSDDDTHDLLNIFD